MQAKIIQNKEEFIRLFRQSGIDRDKRALESWHQDRINTHELAVYLMKNNRMGNIIVPLNIIEELAESLGYGKEND